MANTPNYDARQRRQQERADFRTETRNKQANLRAKTGEINTKLTDAQNAGDLGAQLDLI